MSTGLRRQVALELGTHHATVSVSMRSVSPDDSGFVRFTARSRWAVLCFVHVGTPVAQVEFSFIPA